MLIKSLLTTDNQFNSTEELIQWIQQRNRDVKVSVEAIPFKNMEGWYQDAEGITPEGSFQSRVLMFRQITGK